MGQQEASAAIGGLKDVVMAAPELRAIAEAAKSIDELSALWKNEAFRAAHDRLIGDVQEQDVRDYLSELSDEQLDHVAGGAVMTSTKFNKMNTRKVYVAVVPVQPSPFDMDAADDFMELARSFKRVRKSRCKLGLVGNRIDLGIITRIEI